MFRRASRAVGAAAITAAALVASLLVATPAQAAAFDVLVFSKTAGFRHDSIPAGVTAIQQLGAANDFTVTATEDANQFTDATLAQYEAVVFLSTTGDVLNPTQQAAFERYIRAGGGYAGVHAASDTEYDWPWYGNLVGAYFNAHPANQTAVVKVEDPAHPSTAGLPARWSRFDEWYNFRTNPRGTAHVLASLDETSYAPGGGAMGADHPIAWCKAYDGGRSWYTGGGHTNEAFADAQFRAHLLGGIRTAAGNLSADCGATLTGRFEKVTLDSNTQNPMELDVAPDGRVFYIERDGRVQIVRPSTGTTVTAATIPVFTGNEDGLLGLTLDPGFASNGWLYVYYSPAGGSARNQLSRLTVTGDSISLGSEQVLLQVPTQRNTCCHTGGSMTFDSAGNLYLATGDNTNPFESSGYAPIDERPGRQDFDAQRSSGNTNDLRGKVLRIRPTAAGGYTVPSGNLFAPGTAQTRSEIYAMGFRNPFRIGVDPQTNVLYVADYGPDAGQANPDRGPGNTVEWNIVGQPGNYGWPYCVGNQYAYREYTFPDGPSGAAYTCSAPVNNSPNNTGLTNLPPAVAATVDYDYDGNPRFPEIGGGGAPMGGPVYRYDAALNSARKWPAYYSGKAVLGEWNQSKMYTMQVSADGRSLVDINPLLAGLSVVRPMDLEFGPDGALYLIEWGSGFGGNNDNSGVYRVDYTNPDVDLAPIAVAAGAPTSGAAPLTVQFSSAGSRDPAGQPITYAWTFGDGATSTAANPSHTYTASGTFTAQLTVRDPGGRTAVANVPVVVGNTTPTVRFTRPPDGGFYEWGDQVPFTVTVIDPEDGPIDCSRVVVRYSLGHDEHAHELQQVTGCTGSVQTSLATGHGTEANIFAVLEATYTDRGGLVGRSIVQLQPKRKQAEYFTATGRVAGSTATGDPGVQREATGDTQGGFQNIGFIEDGDWWSFAPTSLTNITSVRLRAASGSTGGRVEVRAGSATGPLLATATVPATAAWQTYTDVTVALPANTASQPLFFVARPPVGVSNGGGLLNVNWVDFVGSGVGGPVGNTPPAVGATANPVSGTAPLTVQFTGTASDPDGDTPLAYRWDFGDGGTATTQNASRTYANAGTYTARLTVTDSRGASASATATVTVTAAPAGALSTNVHLFYYPWYGSPTVNGSYRHWPQGGRTPPNDIGADFYPTLGAYDSADPAVLAQHMQWIRRSGAGVLVYSWWGQGSYEDNIVNAVLNAANAQGIKVAWHIEPYGGRTAASVASDVTYINNRYGGHPAFYRSAQHNNRPAFYVFESLSIANWQPIDAVNDTNIILAQTTDTSKIQYFGGLYTYDVIAGATAPGWEGAGEYAQANNLVWAPSVGPGYIDDRAVPGNTTPTLARNNGATYDTEWTNALDPTKGGLPSWVSVTSFNEWHEGSTIEPARSSPPGGFGYQTYAGAYGTSGAAAETAYLDRTAYWAAEFERRRGGDTTPPSVPGNLRATGQTHNSVSLAWNASTGGPVAYDVYRGSTLAGSVAGTTFTATGLTPSTAYTFTVRARDAAGNASAPSNAVSVTTNAAPVSNLLLNKPATADSSCAAAEGPAKAVNGTVNGGTTDKWCSLGGNRWLQVDIGSATPVGRVVVRHAGAGGEFARWNTRDFDVQVSANGSTWTTVAAVRGNTADVTTHTFTAASARYVRLNVLVPTQDSDQAARIYELEAYGS